MADLISLQNFRNWIDMSPKDYWSGDIRSSLLSYFNFCHIFSQEDKLECLQKLIMELEIEQEAQWICQDSSPFEELSDQEQEQYELKTYEALLTHSKQYKRGYEAIMAHCYKHYDLKPEVSSPNFILPTENESSVNKQSSC